MNPEVSEDSYCSEIDDDCTNESSDCSDDNESGHLEPCQFNRRGLLLSIIYEESEPDESIVEDDASSPPPHQCREIRRNPVQMEMMEILTDGRRLKEKLLAELLNYCERKDAMRNEFAKFCIYTKKEVAAIQRDSASESNPNGPLETETGIQGALPESCLSSTCFGSMNEDEVKGKIVVNHLSLQNSLSDLDHIDTFPLK